MQAISHLYMLKHLFYCRKRGAKVTFCLAFRWISFWDNCFYIFSLFRRPGGRLQLSGDTTRL